MKNPPVPIEQETGWKAGPMWTFRIGDKFFYFAVNRNTIPRTSNQQPSLIAEEVFLRFSFVVIYEKAMGFPVTFGL